MIIPFSFAFGWVLFAFQIFFLFHYQRVVFILADDRLMKSKEVSVRNRRNTFFFDDLLPFHVYRF